MNLARNICGVALAFAFVALLASCASDSRSVDGVGAYRIGGGNEESYALPDWSKLVSDNGRLSYVDGGKTLSRQGIDVSQNQKLIKWKAVKKDGIDFAIIRLGFRGATKGELYTDEQFRRNFKQAKKAGIDVGVYFFSQAVNAKEAVEEAQYVIDKLGGQKLAYPVVFDSERVGASGRTAKLGKAKMTSIAKAFCERVELAGYESLVYGNVHDMARYKLSEVGEYGLWLAHYADTPEADFYFQMWQYSNKGTVKGIDAKVDMDLDLRGVS